MASDRDAFEALTSGACTSTASVDVGCGKAEVACELRGPHERHHNRTHCRTGHSWVDSSQSDRDTLAELIEGQGFELDRGPYVTEWPADEREIHRAYHWLSFDERRGAVQEYRCGKVADAILAAGWRRPARVITTAADLSNLPARSLVLVPEGPRAGVWRAKRSPGWWWCIDRDDHAATHELLMCGEGAVTVLHVPTEEARDGE